MTGLITTIVILVFAVSILTQIFKILREYERAVIYTLYPANGAGGYANPGA